MVRALRVMAGRGPVKAIVSTPLPEMSKSMVEAVEAALASSMACRSDPAPPLSVLVTVKMVAESNCRGSRSS